MTVLFLKARAFDSVLPPRLSMNLAIPVTLPDGRTTTLSELVKPDRPTVINLWASWCGPCRREAPIIRELRQRVGDRVNLIYLNVRDKDATLSELSAYMNDVGLPTNDYARLDESRISQLTGVRNNLIPRTLAFDRRGTPLAMITGYRPLALVRIAGTVD